MQELKPCPCCGSSNGLYVLQEDEYGEWSVFCDMCKTSLHNENHCETRDDAVSAWNRRAERTCRMEYNEEWSGDELYPTECYNCSECHHMTSDGMPSYCPNCGAKVVSDDADR